LGLLLVTLIYISKSYLFSKSYHQELTVRYGPAGTPIIDIEINNIAYPVGIFPGSKFPMTLFEEIMANFEKKLHEKVQWKNGTGASFESFSYNIPKVKIGDLLWTDVVITEKKEEWMRGVVLWENPDTTVKYNKFVGSIGKPFFEKYNVLFDFP